MANDLDQQLQRDKYGPWMPAPRRNRRGRGGTTVLRRNPGEGESGEGSQEPVGVKGSRFSIIADQDDITDNIEQEGAQQSYVFKLGSLNRGRGRRPNVQVNEKQIDKDYNIKDSQGQDVTVKKGLATRKPWSRRATEEKEHTVVMGTKEKVSHRKVVTYEDDIMMVHETNEDEMPEHYSDPPDLNAPEIMEAMDREEASPLGHGQYPQEGMVD